MNKIGYAVIYGPYVYCEKVGEKPTFTYNWPQARIFESYDDADRIRMWLQKWDATNTYKMKEWTKIVSAFRVVQIEYDTTNYKNIRKARENETESKK